MEDLEERARRGETRSWYRVPSGLNSKNEKTRRIARAVDNEDWQWLRHTMKGKTTEQKLRMLLIYWDENTKFAADGGMLLTEENEDIEIRIVNYLKALVRGGQIEGIEGTDQRYMEKLLMENIVIRK